MIPNSETAWEGETARVIPAARNNTCEVIINVRGLKIPSANGVENETVMLSGNVRVKTICSSHPDSTILMRMEKGEASFVYGLDCELTDDFRTIYEAFVKDSSLLLFDGMYNEEELKRYRGFGHSSWEQGLEIQENCNVKQICISHHDWGRTDTELEAIEKEVSEKKKNCIFAKEGMEFFL